MIVTQTPSPNFGPRRDGKTPRFIILHYTDTPSAADALQLMQDPAREVSSHYLVDDKGHIMQLVAEDMRAWHAGRSYWAGETDLNSASIGIEIQNPGHSCGYLPFPAVQIDAVILLCRDIMARHGIAARNVLGHSDIAPGRKIDPGHLFPWEKLAKAGVGVWPEGAADGADDIDAMLIAYGYDPAVSFQTRLTEFQRHFEPETFFNGKAGTPTDRTAALLAELNAV